MKKAGNLTMCPLCDNRCSYWKLEESCAYSQATYLFDNPATVAFACFMALWGKINVGIASKRVLMLEHQCLRRGKNHTSEIFRQPRFHLSLIITTCTSIMTLEFKL